MIHRHSQSLTDVQIYAHSIGWSWDQQDLHTSAITTFHYDAISYSDLKDENYWLYDWIVCNELQQLTLGFEDQAVHAYNKNAIRDYLASNSHASEVSSDFVEGLGKKIGQRTYPCDSKFVLNLDELCLRGFDIHAMTDYQLSDGLPGSLSLIDLECLTTLTLESCPGLMDTLRAWMQAFIGPAQRLVTPNIRSLTVREEAATAFLQGRLERYICTLTGLTKLYVLLESDRDYVINLENILIIHGQTLEHLIWDLRRRPNHSTGRGISELSHKNVHLHSIASRFPSLRELGIALHWQQVREIGYQRGHVRTPQESH